MAVIGGGAAGAFCARLLAENGVAITVFDKARGAGGRMSTRRRHDRRFDHGAQYFTVRDASIRRRVEGWVEQGVVAVWHGPFATLGAGGLRHRQREEPRYVGVPGMSSLVRHLLDGLDVRFRHRVTALRRAADWDVAFDVDGVAGSERFDEVLVTTPAPQAVPLLGRHPFGDRLAAVKVAPCWTLLFTVAEDAVLDWGGLRVEESAIGWIGRNQTRPGRPPGEQWVVQATASWSATHVELVADDVVELLLAEVRRLFPQVEPVAPRAHRWRYALVTEPVGHACLYDADAHLGVAGDGLLGGRVEAALLSGASLAGRVIASF